MMMMMMNKLPLTWHIVLSLQGHVTLKSHIVVNAELMVLVRTAIRPRKKLSLQSTVENWQLGRYIAQTIHGHV